MHGTATFFLAERSRSSGSKNLTPLEFWPKNSHPPMQPHLHALPSPPPPEGVGGQRNQSFLVLSSCLCRNSLCSRWPGRTPLPPPLEVAPSMKTGPRETEPDSIQTSAWWRRSSVSERLRGKLEVMYCRTRTSLTSAVTPCSVCSPCRLHVARRSGPDCSRSTDAFSTIWDAIQ